MALGIVATSFCFFLRKAKDIANSPAEGNAKKKIRSLLNGFREIILRQFICLTRQNICKITEWFQFLSGN